MKDLVRKFINETERARIIDTVKKTEMSTAGEIVPMIVSASGAYPLSAVIGAMALSLPLALIGLHFIGPLLGTGARDLWVFLGIETALFVISYIMVNNVFWIKRLFISGKEIEEEVSRSALESFYKNGLHRTRDETGVLIYISIFEKTVWVLGDRGINEKVSPEVWQEIVSIITGGIKKNRQGDAICRAISRTGEILHDHFPVRPDDRDELPNIITDK
ncbi:MAG: TPM domain-containing protein [Spirochaetes bacterium]|nr:TPM domain-containing protein [Spirochaetota bacterium]